MKVVYAGRDSKKQKALLVQHPDIIVLLYNNWDDFNYKTTFPTDCRMKGSDVEIGAVQILINNEMTSSV
ncbi:MAG: ATP-binding protein, partial [Proteobacteria bacterium]